MKRASGAAGIIAVLLGVAADMSPVAMLASQELSPSITPWPSAWPPACLGIIGGANAVEPGIVGVGTTVAPPADFRLHTKRIAEYDELSSRSDAPTGECSNACTRIQ